MSTERVGRTLAVAVAVALACSAMVSLAVHVLRPIQHAYAHVERNRAILEAAGTLDAEADDAAVVAAYLDLDVRLVDLAAGAFADRSPITDPGGYDHWQVGESDPASLKRADATAPTGPARYVPVYLLWRADVLQRLVLPVHGQGMWSTIYGYLALEPDFDTVAALTIYRHGETPGIGDRIEDPQWLARWQGKRVYDEAGDVRIAVVRQPRDSRYQVDLISGASVTSQSVGRLVELWLGEKGYGPLLQRLRRGETSIEPP